MATPEEKAFLLKFKNLPVEKQRQINLVRLSERFPKLNIGGFAKMFNLPYGEQTVTPPSFLKEAYESGKNIVKGVGTLAASTAGYLSGAEALGQPQGKYNLPALAPMAENITKETVKDRLDWYGRLVAAAQGNPTPLGQRVIEHPIMSTLDVLGTLGGAATIGAIGAKVPKLAQLAQEAKVAVGAARTQKLREIVTAMQELQSTKEGQAALDEIDDVIRNSAGYAAQEEMLSGAQAMSGPTKAQAAKKAGREAKGIMFPKIKEVNNVDLQMRPQGTTQPTLLSELPQQLHEKLAENPSLESVTKNKGQVSKLRGSISKTGENKKGTLSSLSEPGQPNAPLGLQPTVNDNLVVPRMSSRTTHEPPVKQSLTTAPPPTAKEAVINKELANKILPELKAQKASMEKWRNDLLKNGDELRDWNDIENLNKYRKLSEDIRYIEDGFPQYIDNYGGVNSIAVRGLKDYPDLAAKYGKAEPPANKPPVDWGKQWAEYGDFMQQQKNKAAKEPPAPPAEPVKGKLPPARKAELESQIKALDNQMAEINLAADLAPKTGSVVKATQKKLAPLQAAKKPLIDELEGKLGSESGAIRIPAREEVRGAGNRLDPFAGMSRKLADDDGGKMMIDNTIKAETTAKRIQSKAKQIFAGIPQLTRKEIELAKTTFKERFEEGLPQLTDNLEKYAQAWKKIAPEIQAEMQRVGLKGDLKNYFPHMLSDEGRFAMLQQKGKVYDAIIEKLKSEGKLKGDNMTGIEEHLRMMGEDDMGAVRYGNIEKPRILNLPEYVMVDGKRVQVLETDPTKIFPRYVYGASRRIGIIENFGKDTNRIEAIIKMAGNSENAQKIKDLWESIQGIDKRHIANVEFNQSKGGKILGTAEAIARVKQLSLSVVPNLFGWGESINKFGLKNTFAAMKDVALSHFGNIPAKEKLRALEAYGAFERDVLNDLSLTEGLHGTMKDITHGVLKGTGMNAANTFINKISGLGATRSVEHGIDVIRNGDGGLLKTITGGDADTYLRQLQRDFLFSDDDVRRIVQTGLSDSDRARIAQRAPALTNAYGESILDRPLWMRGPIAQRVMSYTSFQRAAFNTTKRAIEEASHGNLAPLVKLGITRTATGEAIRGVRNLIFGRDDRNRTAAQRMWSDFLDGATFGIWGSLWQEISYAKSAADVIKPPQISDIGENVWAIGKSVIKKDPSYALGTFVKTTPAIRMIGANVLRVANPKGFEKEKVARDKIYYSKEIMSALRKGDRKEAFDIIKFARTKGVRYKYEDLERWQHMIAKEKNKKLSTWQKVGLMSK